MSEFDQANDMAFDRVHPTLGRVSPTIANDLCIGFEFELEPNCTTNGYTTLDEWFSLPFWVKP